HHEAEIDELCENLQDSAYFDVLENERNRFAGEIFHTRARGGRRHRSRAHGDDVLVTGLRGNVIDLPYNLGLDHDIGPVHKQAYGTDGCREIGDIQARLQRRIHRCIWEFNFHAATVLPYGGIESGAPKIDNDFPRIAFATAEVDSGDVVGSCGGSAHGGWC